MAIENADEFLNWLKEQSQQTCVIIAARAALRVFPFVTHHQYKNKPLVLLTARAILTSGVAARLPTSEIKAAADAARATYADSRATFAAADAAAAAANASYAAAGVAADGAARATSAAQAAGNAARAARPADGAAYAAAYADSEIGFDPLFRSPLWDEPREPDWLVSALITNENLLESGPEWKFWRNWYQGFLIGDPMDWELQRRVALIDEAIWEAGPEAVAEEIERIKDEFDSHLAKSDTRQPDFEPNSVDRIFKNKHIATANASAVAVEITDAIGRFHADTGVNQLPEPFLPLQAMPVSLGRISAILKHEAKTPETEQKLREEIGRLNAKIAQLETALEAAHQSKEPIFPEAFKKQAAASLGDWKLYGALCAGLWVISGDELGTQKRLENILSWREAIFGEDCPAPDPDTLSLDNPTVET